MHVGWLRLTQTDDRPVWVWATDIAMVAENEIGTVVYVHHDKIVVKDDPEFVIESADAINEQFARDEHETQ